MFRNQARGLAGADQLVAEAFSGAGLPLARFYEPCVHVIPDVALLSLI